MTNDRTIEPGKMRESETLALLQEVGRVDVHSVAAGRVRVSTHTETVEDVAHADLQGEAVEVTRVPVNRPVTGTPPQVRTEGDLTVVPVFEEVLVIEKRLMLKEELHIRRRATVEAVTLPVTLRRQTAMVERLDGDGQPATAASSIP